MAEEDIRGRGVVLELNPASNEGSFSGVIVDEGHAVEAPLAQQMVARVKEKVKKIHKSEKAGCYRRWWLVFDDEIVIASVDQVLTTEERGRIEGSLRECQETMELSKIVMVSRYQTSSPPVKQDKWFYAPWEDPRHPPLPPSP